MLNLPRWSTLALPVALVLLLVGAPLTLAQAELEEDFDRVAEGTAAIRELPLAGEIVESFQTQAELAADLPAQIDEEYPVEEAEGDARAWAAFGLIPPGTDLRRLYTDLLAEQVAGYYDPETDEMVIVTGSGFDALAEYTYSHEVVHALQDQHLGLDELLDGTAARTDDAALAVTSLYEGDAMAASTEYLFFDPALAARMAGSLLTAAPETPLLDAAPPVLVLWFLFPYLAGQPFVEAVRADGGWAAVDAAYADPPASSEQILHPEKYLEGEAPLAVALPDLAPTLGEGWAVIDENVVGELQTAAILADLEPGQGLSRVTGGLDLPEAATDAAAGWGGDRYALWTAGDREVLVWRSAWDSEEEAAEFAGALRAREETRFGGAFEGESAEALAMEAADRAARLERSGVDVTYVLATDPDLADQTLAALRAG